ncbi:hypothetical protein RHMOL_Rhmol02G0066800 [Rhododendron molle]|uniref:Uncharacterized protein n=1 Tax=Rhododendron molle TaxID=49168 RepID=A0ACC0PMN1_RHOML|nr:hypothetical protein RHMOL_Rhmol02G0066800 [Rhododendron molle]
MDPEQKIIFLCFALCCKDSGFCGGGEFVYKHRIRLIHISNDRDVENHHTLWLRLFLSCSRGKEY